LADLNKSSSLKPLGQMNRKLVGSIYGRSSLKIAYFVPIRYQAWPPQNGIKLNLRITMLQFSHCSLFWTFAGEDQLEIRTKWAIFIEDLPNFDSFGQAVTKYYIKIALDCVIYSTNITVMGFK
jgi:hypothetical protein